jgi:D-glycero-alpha-D-manno-heptose-7-phosphate kinase
MSRETQPDPPRVINSTAPVRVCDNGGWTDTWFAGHGAVLSLAVSPGVHVRVEARPRDGGPAVRVEVENVGVPVPGPHALLEAAVAEAGLPDGTALHVAVRSDAPAGASTGTSAAVVTAAREARRTGAARAASRSSSSSLARW